MVFLLSFLLTIFFPFHLAIAGGGSHLSVVCDRWPDVSSLKNFAESSIRILDAKSDEEKAVAVWRQIQSLTAATGVVPREPSLGVDYLIDPVKLLNVYGGHWCDGLSRIMEMAWRSLGYRAQKFYNFGHTLADCYWKDEDGIGRWHLFDVSQHWFVYDRSGKHIATRDELSLDHSLLYVPSRTPAPSRPFLIQPSYVHAGHLRYEPHDMGIGLRSGESLEWQWGNEGKPYQDIFGKPRNDPQHGPYPVTYGNGRLVYEPELSPKAFKSALEKNAANLQTTEEDGVAPALHPSKAGETASATIRVALPYVISDSWVNAPVIRESLEDRVRFSVSTDGGKRWRTVWEATNELGEIDLKAVDFCERFDPNGREAPRANTPFGRYDYLFRIEFKAAKRISGCGLERLSLVTVFQHNLFSLPMLWPGKNRITVGGDLKPGSAVRITYFWDDGRGKGQSHIVTTGKVPFQYEILTKGRKWEDVICRRIKMEAFDQDRSREILSDQNKAEGREGKASFAQRIETDRLIGNSRPPSLKSASHYIRMVEDGLDRQKSSRVDSKRSPPSNEIGHAILCLAAIKDRKAKAVLERVIREDRTHPFQNKIWACQALYLSVGREAAPLMMRILERDPSILWRDSGREWSQDAMWLRTAGTAAAVLSDIEEFEGRERAADLITGILKRETLKIDPKKIEYGEETEWGMIKSLGKLGNRKHVPVIRSFLKEDSDARTSAVQALGNIGDVSAIPDLLTVLRGFQYSPNGLSAVEGLGKIGTREIAPQLYPFLFHWDEDFRAAAAKSLGRIGNWDSIPHLKEMMRAESFPWVMEAAKESLRLLGE